MKNNLGDITLFLFTVFLGFLGFIARLFEHLLAVKDDIEKQDYQSLDQRSIKPACLYNTGSTCYLNSALQALSSSPQFTTDIHRLAMFIQGASYKCPKLDMLDKLLQTINQGGAIEISNNSIFKSWNKPGHQDSFELISYVINEVYHELRIAWKDQGYIRSRMSPQWFKSFLPMRIILNYEISCDNHHVACTPLQSDLALHLTMDTTKDVNDIQILLNNFFKLLPINDFKCDTDNCNMETGNRKTILCPPLPATLCIHLQRSKHVGYKMEKLNIPCNYSPILRIPRDKGVLKDRHGFKVVYRKRCIKNTRKTFIKKKRPPCIKYKLNGVISHFGTINFGHYICYRRMNGEWYLTNDGSVRKVAESSVLNLQDAYIFFYERFYE